jgi:hypothetical protein
LGSRVDSFLYDHDIVACHRGRCAYLQLEL